MPCRSPVRIAGQPDRSVRFAVPLPPGTSGRTRTDHAERTSQSPMLQLPAPRRCALRRARARGPVRGPCGLRRAPDLVRRPASSPASRSARSPAPSRSCPGLLILVPAAVGMRGNVFGALGSRLGTAVHTGTFRLSWRIDTLVGQNLASAVALSMASRVPARGRRQGLRGRVRRAATRSRSLDFVVVSVVGGLIPSSSSW